MLGRSGYSDARGLLAMKLREAYARRGGMANVGHMAYADADYGGALTKEQKLNMQAARKVWGDVRRQIKASLLKEHNRRFGTNLKRPPKDDQFPYFKKEIERTMRALKQEAKGKKAVKSILPWSGAKEKRILGPRGPRKPNEYSKCIKEYGAYRKLFSLPPNRKRLKKAYNKKAPAGSRCNVSDMQKKKLIQQIKKQYLGSGAMAGALGGATAGVLYDVYDKGGYIDDYDYLE